MLFRGGVGNDAADGGLVVRFEDPAERVGQELLGEGGHEGIGALEQRGAQRCGAVDGRAVD
jgi:hypothetical protein